MKRLLSLLLVLSLIFTPATSLAASSPISTTIKSVYDGDTFTIELNGKSEKIRLIGVDTPKILPLSPSPLPTSAKG